MEDAERREQNRLRMKRAREVETEEQRQNRLQRDAERKRARRQDEQARTVEQVRFVVMNSSFSMYSQ